MSHVDSIADADAFVVYDCDQRAETLIELHDENGHAYGPEYIWFELKLCAEDRDELVDAIARGDDDVLGLTIESMTSIDDTQLTACERA